MTDRQDSLRGYFGLVFAGVSFAQASLGVAAYYLFDLAGVTACIVAVAACGAIGFTAWRLVVLQLERADQRVRKAVEVAAFCRAERDACLQTATHDCEAAAQKSSTLEHPMFDKLERLKGNSNTLRLIADDLSRTTLQMTIETTSVSVAAQDANRQMVALNESGRDFLKTISTIERYTAQSAKVGIEAYDLALATSVKIDELTASFDKIGSMTKLISGIANQTSLLAVNAAIEAARTNNKGNGFAVLATEIKCLAQETGKAVTLISDLVKIIRGSTVRVNDAIRATAASIGDLNERTAMIATAVEDRVQAAVDMADSVARAKSNISVLESSAVKMQVIADTTAHGAELLRGTSVDIATDTTDLCSRVDNSDNPFAASAFAHGRHQEAAIC